MKLGWERRMDAEMRFHLESMVEDLVRQGLSRSEAERRALQEFGAVALAKDECRDTRRGEWFASVLRDARYALRWLRKSPGFAAAAAITIGLGVGANTAIFSLIYSALLRPLPYADPEQLYTVEVVIPERSSKFPSIPVTIQSYLGWRKAETPFSAMAALRPWECNLTGDGEPERLGGARVSANFFSVLGVQPARGRWFSASEETPGRENVVVISDALWRRRYAADAGVVGKSIDVNGVGHLVVGIAPASLLVPTGTQLHALARFAPRVDVWKPIAPGPQELQRESWDHGVIVRLRPGEAAENGRQQLQAVLNGLLRSQVPGLRTEFQTRLVPIRDIYGGRVRPRLLLALGAAAMLLLIACTNMANLLLARTVSRSGEHATRVALGASRGRILIQMLTESTVLALLGAAAGLVLAWAGSEALMRFAPGELRQFARSALHAPVFVFALTVSLATGMVCGVVPAWKAYRSDLVAGIRSAAAGMRSREILVGVEVALCTVLLVSAGLLLHSFVNVMRADRGYDVERILAVDLSLFGQRYDKADSRVAFYRDVAVNLRAIPGVTAAGVINDLPATAGSSGASQVIFHPTDTDYRSLVLLRPVAMIRAVTSGYFAASGTGLRAGRYFGEQEPQLVAVISESLAKSLWPGEPAAAAVGRAVRQGGVDRPPIPIAGVVEDVRPGAGDGALPPMIYRPHAQWASGPATVVVRTAQEPAAVAAAVRSAIRDMDANLPIPAIRTMTEIVAEATEQRRFQTLLTLLFATTALLLGAVGIYGVVAYSVARRTRDIGLRMALGAVRGDVMQWVFTSGMRPVVFGLTAGMAGAVAVATMFRSQLFETAPVDPISLGAVAVVLLGTSALACWAPARRAAAVDPIVALRSE